jgi:hypothetical protein
MSIRLTVLIAAPLLAAGCNEPSTSAPRQAITVRSDAQNQLHQLTDLNRHIGLKRAIQAAGMRCQRVDKSGYVQEHNNLSLWMASCDAKTDYSIFVGPDGGAQVRRCAEHAELKLPACVIKEKAAGPASPTAS